ncbi:MAG: hypothetical protein NVSMB12_09440 [Acidimicrobiales bacterium]
MENESEHESRAEGADTIPTPVASDTELVPTVSSTPDPPAGPGWFLDPWDHAQHRFWDGRAWTGETFPNGPQSPAPAPEYWREIPERRTEPGSPPPPPAWTPAPAALPPRPAPDPVIVAERRNRRALAVIAMVIGLIVGFVIAFAVGIAARHSGSSRSAAALPTLVPPTTRPSPGVSPTIAPGFGGGPASADPSASALQALVLRPADVTGALTVEQIPRGNLVAGEATLDLCNAPFASEALRTARLQVAALAPNGDAPLSTEAVLYGRPSGSAQAFTELRAAAASCPPTPRSGAGGDLITTRINPAPDGAWPSTPTVERLAFDFTTTDRQGQVQHFVAVYLRRGRVLEGLYFAAPDGPQPAIAGQTTIPDIVGIFASRLAQLTPSVVDG